MSQQQVITPSPAEQVAVASIRVQLGALKMASAALLRSVERNHAGLEEARGGGVYAHFAKEIELIRGHLTDAEELVQDALVPEDERDLDEDVDGDASEDDPRYEALRCDGCGGVTGGVNDPRCLDHLCSNCWARVRADRYGS